MGLIKVDDYDKALSTIQNLPSTLNDFNFYKAYLLSGQNKLDEARVKNGSCMDVYQRLRSFKIVSLEVNIVACLVSAGRASEVQGMMDSLKLAESDTADSSQNLLDVCVLSHYNQIICETEGLDALRPLIGQWFMSLLRFKLWWMTQRMGMYGKDIPLETQFMLVESKDDSSEEDSTIYTVFLTLLEGQVDLTAYVEKHEFCFDAVLDEQVSNDEVPCFIFQSFLRRRREGSTGHRTHFRKELLSLSACAKEGGSGIGFFFGAPYIEVDTEYKYKILNLLKLFTDTIWSDLSEPMDLLGDDWVQIHRRTVQQHANHYKRNHMLLFLLVSMELESPPILQSVMMAVCDTFQSGAVEQLRTHARRLQIPIFEKGYEKDPAVVAKEAIQEATSH
ncbi:hypothetical protein IFM89_004896 [Coptis chinensis]|uniref:SRP54-type proteins GTP-binding domain-containing protein n=1 Tax=Coptis chinensis TaxID=261450 RepID=A0A835HW26_9MAGN|nr:hypothetical protein IFM89_004896 [Coptis chinensis]